MDILLIIALMSLAPVTMAITLYYSWKVCPSDMGESKASE